MIDYKPQNIPLDVGSAIYVPFWDGSEDDTVLGDSLKSLITEITERTDIRHGLKRKFPYHKLYDFIDDKCLK